MMLKKITEGSFWNTWGVLIARLIIAAVFALGLSFKLMGIDMTAAAIAAAGFPIPLVLAWLAAILEALLVIAFMTGMYFRQAALVALVYVLFLGFAFHGPSHWEGNQMEFGFFVDHFTFAAGLLFMIAHGVGNGWKINRGN